MGESDYPVQNLVEITYMNQVSQVRDWPTDAIVEAIQGKVVKTYEQRTVSTANGEKTIQNAELQDAAGDKIRLAVWDHPDLRPLEGMEVVLKSNRSGNGKVGGVKVVHGSYTAKKDGNGHKAGEVVKTCELSVSKLGTFQQVAMAAASQSAKPTPALSESEANVRHPDPSVPPAQLKIYGGTVGVGINQACAYLISKGEQLTSDRVHEIASELVKVALKMEQGSLYEKKEEAPF